MVFQRYMELVPCNGEFSDPAGLLTVLGSLLSSAVIVEANSVVVTSVQ